VVRKSEGNIPLGRPRHRWEDNTKMYLQEIRKAADVNGIDLAEDWDKQWAFVNLVMKNLVFIIFQEFPD